MRVLCVQVKKVLRQSYAVSLSSARVNAADNKAITGEVPCYCLLWYVGFALVHRALYLLIALYAE